MEKLIDAHSHLWLKQDTVWNGKPIRSLANGRSIFLGEEVQMLPPFMTDSRNTAEVFLSNMDYAQVSAAVVVQEFIDGNQNTYLEEVQRQYPDRFVVCGMCDFDAPDWAGQVRQLASRGFRGMAIPAHRLAAPLNSEDMMLMFKAMEEQDMFLSITLADGSEQVAQMQEVIAECPQLRIALGHLCMANPPLMPAWENPDWRAQVRLARHPNVFIETGGMTWLYNSEFYPFPSAVRAIREAAELVGMNRLMWGSDYPRTITAITYRMSYDFILKSREFSEQEKWMFLGENAQKFYRLKALKNLPYIKNMSE